VAGDSLPAVDIRVSVFTTRLAIRTKGNNVEITVLTRVLVVIIPAPWVLEAGRFDIGSIPSAGIA
jgi:hypothetical protein